MATAARASAGSAGRELGAGGRLPQDGAAGGGPAPLPVDITPEHLGALASAFGPLAAGEFDDLAESFGKLVSRRAAMPEPMARFVGRLGAQLRAAAQERRELEAAP